jgi:hypothetical protein
LLCEEAWARAEFEYLKRFGSLHPVELAHDAVDDGGALGILDQRVVCPLAGVRRIVEVVTTRNVVSHHDTPWWDRARSVIATPGQRRL